MLILSAWYFELFELEPWFWYADWEWRVDYQINFWKSSKKKYSEILEKHLVGDLVF